MIEALNSLNDLNENYEKLTSKVGSVDGELKTLKSGKSSLKSMFSFKSKEEDINNYEKEKTTLESQITDLSQVIKIASYNMEYYIEYFKVEKLAEYYRHLREFAENHTKNNTYLKSLWENVMKDKNLQKVKDRENSVSSK